MMTFILSTVGILTAVVGIVHLIEGVRENNREGFGVGVVLMVFGVVMMWVGAH